ncbi:MAG: PHP domain-containing protein [Treponema sp.]|nr:PHP domain-containing protein [Treponema sp.]
MTDLHTHSTASDGKFSPSALMEEAARRGLSSIALTDHDTIGGLAEAAQAAQDLKIHFIPGIELEIAMGSEGQNPAPGEFHLLGLGIHKPSAAFLEAVDELARRREGRNKIILGKMREAGIDVHYEDIKALGGDSIGRPHFAAFLVDRGIVKNIEEAFSRYLGKDKPFYMPKEGLEFNRAAALIKESGGAVILAHPMSLYVAWGKLPGLIEALKERGLDGIEAWHPIAKESACLRLRDLGKKLGLIVTAGSDFHGNERRRKLGVTAGERKIDDSYLEGLEPFIHPG